MDCLRFSLVLVGFVFVSAQGLDLSSSSLTLGGGLVGVLKVNDLSRERRGAGHRRKPKCKKPDCRAWREVAKTRPVHRETYKMTKYMRRNGIKMWHEMASLDEARVSFDAQLLQNGPDTFDGSVLKITLPPVQDLSAVPLTIYRPANAPAVPNIVIFLHGGGLIFGTAESYKKVMQKLATTSGAIVVGVEYRLLPDAGEKLAPVVDCVYASSFVVGNREAVGGTAESKIGLVGDSAGGQLAIITALEVQGIDFQIPIYPVTDVDFTTQSCIDLMDVPVFNTKDILWMMSHLTQFEVLPEELPVGRPDLGQSPPMLLIIAGLCPLQDAEFRFAEVAKAAGVNVKLSVYPGVTHGFVAYFDHFPTTAGKAFDEMAQFINSF